MGRALAAIGTGLVDGAVATIAMTGAMSAEQRLGLLPTIPPDEVTERAAKRAGASGTENESAPSGKGTDVLAAVLHLGFGMAAGVLFGLIRAVVAPSLARRIPGPVAGALYATAIWAVSYAGWIPALGLLPPPTNDASGSRPPAMLLAHLVYGSVLGVTGDLAEQLPSRAVGFDVAADAG